MDLKFTTVLLGALLASGASGCATPEGKARTAASATELRGTITAVEHDGTIIVRPEGGQPKGFNADPKTATVVRDGRPATFADLRPGDAATVRVVDGRLEVGATSPGRPAQ